MGVASGAREEPSCAGLEIIRFTEFFRVLPDDVRVRLHTVRDDGSAATASSSLMGYTAELSGYAMSSGGLATIICMPIVGFLISKVDGRYLIMFGFTAMALALFYMTSLDLQMSFAYAAKL